MAFIVIDPLTGNVVTEPNAKLVIHVIVPLDQIARAHELVEHPAKPGRVIVQL